MVDKVLAQFSLVLDQDFNIVFDTQSLDTKAFKEVLDKLCPDDAYLYSLVPVIEVCNERINDLKKYLLDHFELDKEKNAEETV